MIKTVCKPYGWWIEKIRSQDPFTFVRYGDGELNAIAHGRRTKNGDGHTLRNKQMRRQLIRSITQPGQAPNYYRSLWMDDRCQPVEQIARNWIPKNAPGLTWYNALAIHFKNISGENYPYFKTMRELAFPIVIIGPQHLRAINQVGCFDYAGFVEVPYRRAYFAKDRILEEALVFESPCLYSIHAGPPSPIFAHQLWKERGDSCIILDLGSILDGYVSARYGGPVEGGGPITRKFWKRRATHKLLMRNLHG